MKKWWWKFEPDKWLGDEALMSCSLAAQGLWIKMLCRMSKSARIGYLTVGGKKPTNEQLSNMLGHSFAELEPLLTELQEAGVFSVSDDQIIFSRKMVRDHAKSIRCSDAGKKGGNPTLKGRLKGRLKPPLKRAPYSNSNSCSDSSGEGECEGKPRPRDPVWDKVTELWWNSGYAPGERTRIGKLVRDFKAKKATPEEIEARAMRYKQQWPNAAPTPEALVKHWDLFRADKSAPSTPQVDWDFIDHVGVKP